MTTALNPTIARVSVVGPATAGGDWKVTEQDGTVVVIAASRGEAREQARQINADRTREAQTQGTLDEPSVHQPTEPEVADTVVPEPEADPVPEVEAGQESPSESTPEPEEQAQPEAPVDQAPEAQTEPEAPEVPQAETPKPKPAKAKTRKTPDVPTLPIRAGMLVEGDLYVRKDIGIVTVAGVSKIGKTPKGDREIAYEKADGTVGLYVTWASTHARIVDPAHMPTVAPAPKSTPEPDEANGESEQGSQDSNEQESPESAAA